MTPQTPKNEQQISKALREILDDGLRGHLSDGLTMLLLRFDELQVPEQSAMLAFFCGIWLESTASETQLLSFAWNGAYMDLASIFTRCSDSADLMADRCGADGNASSDTAK